MLQYAVHAENKSLYNTPPVFAIYVMRLVLTWLLKQGGLEAIEQVNARKATSSTRRSIGPASTAGTRAKDSRSRMNVTFRLPSEELEKKFVKEATAAGLDGLKGHRSVGGLRASIYNAFPEGRRRCARGLHAGIRAEERLARGSAKAKKTGFGGASPL